MPMEKKDDKIMASLFESKWSLLLFLFAPPPMGEIINTYDAKKAKQGIL